MRTINLIAASFWSFFLLCSVLAGLAGPRPAPPAALMPPEFLLSVLLVSFLASFLLAYLPRKRVREGYWFTDWINRKWGQGTYLAFVQRLRPVAAIMAACFVVGILTIVSAHLTGQNWELYFRGVLALSWAFGFLIAYLVSFVVPPSVL